MGRNQRFLAPTALRIFKKVNFLKILRLSEIGHGPPIRQLGIVSAILTRSSNGRTTVFGAVNRGSSPCRVALGIKHSIWSVFALEIRVKEQSGRLLRGTRKAFESDYERSATYF